MSPATVLPWTQHNTDFAKGLSACWEGESIGEIYHITSDEVLTWNQIYQIIGNAVGVEPNLIYIPSKVINHPVRDRRWFTRQSPQYGL